MPISALTAAHWPEVKAIYEAGIATGQATFTTEVPAWADWDASHLAHSRLVVLDEAGRVLAWAALAPVSSRRVYAGVAEVSIYVATGARGQGVGRQLLNALISSAEAQGLWTLQAGIFLENAASLALHAAHGFRLVGRRERIAQLAGVWRDTLLLERRSPVVGNLDFAPTKPNILVLCTGNSCRSQLLHGYLQQALGDRATVYSAGIETHGLNPRAVRVLAEDGLDISHHTSNHVDEYAAVPFAYVLTVCDHAHEACPVFPSSAQKLHHNFPDPAKATGTEAEIMQQFRAVRDEVKAYAHHFVQAHFGAN